MWSQNQNKSEECQKVSDLLKHRKSYSILSRNRNLSSTLSLLSPPQSSEANSNQLRYLSHFDQTTEIQPLDQRETYLSIFYKAVIYVRKDHYRTQIDDGLLLELLQQHIAISVQPVPITPVGTQLLMNGYILVALAILLSRQHKSTFLLGYLFNMFIYNYQVKENERELCDYGSRGAEEFMIPVEEKSRPNDRGLPLKRTHTRNTMMGSNAKITPGQNQQQ